MRRTLLIWLAVIVSIRIIESVSWLSGVAGALVAIALVYPPVLASWRDQEALGYWHLNGEVVRDALRWFFIAAGIVFPIALFANHFYQKIVFGAAYALSLKPSAPWGAYVLSQLVLVAFPEEFFFRGFIQEQFSARFAGGRKIFGASFGSAQLMASGLFALSHSLIAFRWWHAFIFFPSLVFAWLKEKTGTIWAGALFHATCNVFAYWVALHYR